MASTPFPPLARVVAALRRQAGGSTATAPLPAAPVRGQSERGEIVVNGQTIAKPYVLVTATHGSRQRCDLLISAIRQLASAGMGVSLVFAGRHTAYTRALMGFCKGLHMSGVHFTGAVADVDLERLHSEACAYADLALEPGATAGIAAAMAREVPVVAWRHAGSAALIDDGATGHLVTPLALDELAARIRALVSDPASARALARAARRRIEVASSSSTEATQASAFELMRLTSLARVAEAAIARREAEMGPS